MFHLLSQPLDAFRLPLTHTAYNFLPHTINVVVNHGNQLFLPFGFTLMEEILELMIGRFELGKAMLEYSELDRTAGG